MDKETIIGMLNDYDDTRLVTFDELKAFSEDQDFYSIKQLLDWRFHTNLTKFIYDPFTGEKINWDELKKSI